MNAYTEQMQLVLNFINSLSKTIEVAHDAAGVRGEYTLRASNDPVPYVEVVKGLAAMGVAGAEEGLKREGNHIAAEMGRMTNRLIENNKVPAAVLLGKWEEAILRHHFSTTLILIGRVETPSLQYAKLTLSGHEVMVIVTGVRKKLVVETKDWLENKQRAGRLDP